MVLRCYIWAKFELHLGKIAMNLNLQRDKMQQQQQQQKTPTYAAKSSYAIGTPFTVDPVTTGSFMSASQSAP